MGYDLPATEGQPLGQDRRSSLEVARKVRAPELSCSTKTSHGGYGVQFAENRRREKTVRRVSHRRAEVHPFSVSGILLCGEPLELVHGDICVSIKPATPGDKTFFILLVDNKSRFMWLILLQAKSEAPEVIKHIQARAGVECGKKITSPHLAKLDPRGLKVVFISYEPESKAYRL